MKIEMPDNQTVVIDDANIVVTRNAFGQYVLGFGPDMVQTSDIQSDREVTLPAKDPHYYMNGMNGLSVPESVERALNRVFHEIWNNFTATDIGDINLLREVITTMISEGQGRQAVYALAGGIKKGYVNGYYEGVPLAWVMKGYIDGHISNNGASYPQATPRQNKPEPTIEDFMRDVFGFTGR
jgi:hypothetical protein